MVPLARRLARSLHVLAPDLPGFGRSEKPARALDIGGLADALNGWLVTLGLRRVVLVGHSLGCQTIASFAARHPHVVRERVVGAVLAGPTTDRRARSTPIQLLGLLRTAPRERASLLLVQVADLWDAGVPRAWRTHRAALVDPIEARLSSLHVPTLVVRGTRDPLVPASWAREVVARLPRGRLHEIPGGPHAVHYTRPDAFAGIVEEFVRSLRVAEGAEREERAERGRYAWSADGSK
jgi:pimeloyl-ACP methyl ester carboxylesterase